LAFLHWVEFTISIIMYRLVVGIIGLAIVGLDSLRKKQTDFLYAPSV